MVIRAVFECSESNPPFELDYASARSIKILSSRDRENFDYRDLKRIGFLDLDDP